MKKQLLNVFIATLLVLFFLSTSVCTIRLDAAPSPLWQTDFENASISHHRLIGVGRAQGSSHALRSSFEFDGGTSMDNVWIEGFDKDTGVTPHSGDRCLVLETTGNAYRNEWNIYQSEFPTLGDTLYVSEWFYIPEGQTLGDKWPFLDLFQLSTYNPPTYCPFYSFGIIAINDDNTMDATLCYRWAPGDDGKTDPTGYRSAPIPLGQWFHFEWYSVIAPDGVIKVWIDGNLIIDLQNYNVSTNGYEYYLSTDVYHDEEDTATYRLYIDDVAVYNTLPYEPKPSITPSPSPTPTPTVQLTVSADSHGSVSPSGSQTLTVGQTYSFTATASSGYKFDHWDLNGEDVGSVNPYSLTAEQGLDNANLKAYFITKEVPLTISLLSPRNTTYTKSDVPITVSLNNPAVWLGYSLDGQSNKTISGNTTLSDLADGSHSLAVYARDRNGKTVGSEIVHFTVRTGPPPEKTCSVTVEANGGKVYVDFDLAAVVNQVNYVWDVDSVHKLYAEPTFTSVSGTQVTFSHWDDGNTTNPRTITAVSNVTYTAIWDAGPIPLSLSISSPSGNESFTVNDVPLVFNVTGSASWIGYSLDGQANVTVTANMTLNELPLGSHNITVYAKDYASNTVSSGIEYFFIEPPREPTDWSVVIIIFVVVAVVVAVVVLLRIPKIRYKTKNLFKRN
ncbi:MAG: hypothetical protein NWF00_09335 [Candidatus Bathyarchaeota archaeon]|nr:hypothetical protein [Candidatus Bathyarchaeota archaeon]